MAGNAPAAKHKNCRRENFIFSYYPVHVMTRKIAESDDVEVVGDRITHCGPIPRNVFAQEAQGGVGELGDGCVAFVVDDVAVDYSP